MPVQVTNNGHVKFNNGQMLSTNGQIAQGMGYSIHNHSSMNPNNTQSGIYAQKQSVIPPGGILSFIIVASSLMHGSIRPVRYSQHFNLSNVDVAQSNYIPNY